MVYALTSILTGCRSAGVSLQAMDTSHVSLVSLLLRAEGFEPYRCDRNISLGINMNRLVRVCLAASNGANSSLICWQNDANDEMGLVFAAGSV